MVSFVQFKKREKHSWKSVNFSKVAGLRPATLLKAALLHECFLNCTNDTKSRKASHMQKCIKKMLKSSVLVRPPFLRKPIKTIFFLLFDSFV